MTNISNIEVLTPSGELLRIGDCMSGPTVFTILRYYG